MGLRERNAAQTRELIVDAAVELFLANGYDETRMEEVAERADIGTSTLYRYFPTKDRLITDPLAMHGQMAAEVDRRPAEEPLDLALGHALEALLLTPRPDTERVQRLRSVIAVVPSVQHRLRDQLEEERVLLTRAIAGRLGRAEHDLFCQMTARSTISLLEIIGGPEIVDVPEGDELAARSAVARLTRQLEQVHAEPPVLARLPALDRDGEHGLG